MKKTLLLLGIIGFLSINWFWDKAEEKEYKFHFINKTDSWEKNTRLQAVSKVDVIIDISGEKDVILPLNTFQLEGFATIKTKNKINKILVCTGATRDVWGEKFNTIKNVVAEYKKPSSGTYEIKRHFRGDYFIKKIKKEVKVKE